MNADRWVFTAATVRRIVADAELMAELDQPDIVDVPGKRHLGAALRAAAKAGTGLDYRDDALLLLVGLTASVARRDQMDAELSAHLQGQVPDSVPDDWDTAS